MKIKEIITESVDNRCGIQIRYHLESLEAIKELLDNFLIVDEFIDQFEPDDYIELCGMIHERITMAKIVNDMLRSSCLEYDRRTIIMMDVILQRIEMTASQVPKNNFQ